MIATARKAGAIQGLTLAVASFLPVIAIVSLAPAVPSLIGHFGKDPRAGQLIPLIVTAPGLMIALFSPLAGWVTDRIGRRQLLLWSTFFYGFFGLAPIFLNDIATIFATRLGVGLSEAGILTVTNALIADYFEVKERRFWLTVQGIMGPIFGALVIASSGALTETMWNGCFLIYGIAFLVFLSMLFFMFEPTHKAGSGAGEVEPPSGAFPWAKVAGFSAVTLFSSIIYYVYIVNGGLAFQSVGVTSPSQIGAAMSFASIGVFVGGGLFGFLSRRLPSNLLIALFLLLLGAGLSGIGLARTLWTMEAAALVQQLGAGMAVVTLIFWVSLLIAPEHRGRGMGFWSTAFFLGQFISPAIVGALHSASSNVLPSFLALGVVSLVGGAAALLPWGRILAAKK